MKVLVFLAFVAVGQCALLGSRKCTWGPAYWCSHVDHARECNAMEHCMATAWKNQLKGLTGSTESCYDVIQILDDLRQSGAPNLMEKMAESCTAMTAEKRSVCKELMKNSEHEVLLLLQSDLPSVNIATALKLCGSVSDSVPHPHVDNKQDIHKSGNYCTDCLNFFGDLREIVNNTEEKIAQKLKDKVCTRLGYFEQLCNETVDTYTHFIMTILAQQLNPEDLCFLFQLCASETHAEFINRVQYIATKAQLHKVECDVCQDIAKDVQNTLRNTALQNDILSTLENKVCALLPGDLADQCKSYVSEYGPMVFEVLVAELDPATICQTLGFCSDMEMEKPALVSVPLSKAVTTVGLLSPEHRDQAQSSPQCLLCMQVMKELEDMITSNSTEEEIVEAVEKVCNLIPVTQKAECRRLIEKYGREIVELLMKEMPDAVCTSLGLCFGDQPVHVDLSVRAVKSDKKCAACETLIAFVRQYIEDPGHTKTIEQLLDEVCVIVPESYRGLCTSIVNTYAPNIITLLNKYDDPVKLCTELKMCKSKETESNKSGPAAQPLLFVPMAELQPAMPRVDCSQGPDVWCSSRDNAKRCNAMKYCVEKKKLKMDG